MPFLSTRQFWQLKISQPPVHDLVLAGNSRVFLGLAPRYMAQALPGRKIYNFGFVACSLERPYLEHAARLLDTGSPQPSLVVGITPHSLMPQTRSNKSQGYMHWSGQKPAVREELLRQIRRDNLVGLAQVRSAARNLWHLLHTRAPGRYFMDGWEASVPPLRRQEGYAQRMPAVYKKQPLNKAVLTDLLKMVQEFRQKGIAVYGFRPPGDDEMRQMEDEHSGLDFGELARRFDSAGGTWLSADETGFPTYDGVHMGFKPARRFSRHLADLIAQAERS